MLLAPATKQGRADESGTKARSLSPLRRMRKVAYASPHTAFCWSFFWATSTQPEAV